MRIIGVPIALRGQDQGQTASYVGSMACETCHPAIYGRWNRSRTGSTGAERANASSDAWDADALSEYTEAEAGGSAARARSRTRRKQSGGTHSWRRLFVNSRRLRGRRHGTH
jgi:hypothetical protein